MLLGAERHPRTIPVGGQLSALHQKALLSLPVEIVEEVLGEEATQATGLRYAVGLALLRFAPDLTCSIHMPNFKQPKCSVQTSKIRGTMAF